MNDRSTVITFFRKMFYIVTLTCFAGCSSWKPSTDVARFDNTVRKPKGGNVQIFTDRSLINRPYREIGLIHAKEGEWDAYYGTGSEAKLIKMMQDNASELGADAIILLPADQSLHAGAVVGSAYGFAGTSSYGEKVLKAIAIEFTDKSTNVADVVPENKLTGG